MVRRWWNISEQRYSSRLLGWARSFGHNLVWVRLFRYVDDQLLTTRRFDGGNAWVQRRDMIINIIKTNTLAPYVVRSVDVGSEPLYDWVSHLHKKGDVKLMSRSLGPSAASFGRSNQVSIDEAKLGPSLNDYRYVRGLIGSYGIQVSISEMEYGYSVQGNSQMVLDAEDVVHARRWKSLKTDRSHLPSALSPFYR